ncbi:MAG TPA: DNA repair protein RadC [Vicinamibacterales bacterium]|nr:DNA repair protein RadC [Vicinamibacterales bacterium]
MKDLSPGDRPREKLLRHGASALGDNELVALVLGSGTRASGALAIANALLAACGGIHGLARAASEECAAVAGIGPARAAQVAAAVELGRRSLTRPRGRRPQLRDPGDVAAYLLPSHGGHPVEQVGIVLLDTRHRVLRTSLVASGSLNASIVEPRDVFREAIRGGASAIVLFHNHPSGDPSPSPDDLELTRRIQAAGLLVGVQLVDHIILGDGCYCSLRRAGGL